MSEQKSNKNILVGILALLLVASLAGNVFQFFNTKEIIHEKLVTKLVVDSLTIRKDRLEAEYTASIAQLEQYKGENAEMDSLLQEAYAKIDAQKKKINYLIGENQDYQVLKQRMAEMRETVAIYEKQIQELREENKRLTAENTDLKVQVDQTYSENTKLKDKVDVASKLKVISMSLKGLSVTNGGKEKPTDKAGKTERISISYTLDENPLAQTGSITIYFRIINPEGFLLADAGQSVKKFKSEKGDELAYSRSITTNYEGTRLTKSITWDQDAFNAGTYKVEVYIDGYFAGSEKLSLY